MSKQKKLRLKALAQEETRVLVPSVGTNCPR